MSLVESKTSYYYNSVLDYGVFIAPTGNCQVFSIFEAREILSHLSDDSAVKKEFQRAAEIVGRKKIALVDINEKYCDRLDRIFKNQIIKKTPYTSTNDSEMCIYLIKITFGLYD